MGAKRSPSAGTGHVELARLLVIRNVAVVFIVLAAMVSIVAITARRGMAGLPTALSFNQPGQQNPFGPPAQFYIDPAQTWSYEDVNNPDLSARAPVSDPIEYTWACGCKDVLDPAKERDLFIRSDPRDEVRRRHKQYCHVCAAALNYLEWKEEHGR
jgi:hypothetical protein